MTPQEWICESNKTTPFVNTHFRSLLPTQTSAQTSYTFHSEPTWRKTGNQAWPQSKTMPQNGGCLFHSAIWCICTESLQPRESEICMIQANCNVRHLQTDSPTYWCGTQCVLSLLLSEWSEFSGGRNDKSSCVPILHRTRGKHCLYELWKDLFYSSTVW